MPKESSTPQAPLSNQLTEAAVRIALIIFLVIMCWRVFAPFSALLTWALILAVSLYPLQRGLARRLGGRMGRAATVIVVIGLLLIGAPTVMLGGSFAGHVQTGYLAFENHTLSIPSPPPSVAEWPLVGKQIYGTWSAAAENFPAFLKEHEAQLRGLSKKTLSAAASTVGTVVLFLGALIVAGIIMAYGEAGTLAIRKILNGLAGPTRGPHLQTLSTATVRSVAVGVIGVAFIQALLLGVGFMMAGIPAAGLLALLALLLGILQLPAALVSFPAIAYLWMSGDASTTSNVVYSVYLVAAGLSDGVLKPMLLGRGVDVPMPIILIGALGGMIASGLIGLFTGAVLLAVGYRIFMEWIDNREREANAGAHEVPHPEADQPSPST